MHGPPGCHPKGTKVLMYDGQQKNVENIVVGDFLLGPDKNPRKVLQLFSGTDEMYEINVKELGSSLMGVEKFVVNAHHILHLTNTYTQKPWNISVQDYSNLSTNHNFNQLFYLTRLKIYDDHRLENVKMPVEIHSINQIGQDVYYGFELDQDHLYMTSDGIIHHNSGKSSVIKMLIRDVIARGGIALDFDDVRSFEIGIDVLRKIHPTKPVVCIMEDLESIVRNQPISSILNVLDGSTNYLTNIVFVATSNYPEALEARIKDRPSRFDRVIEVGLPSAEMRSIYLEHLFTNACINKKVIKKWVQETDGLTFPHLQELFLSVNLYDLKYDDALNRIKSMSKSLSSDKHRRKVGFEEIFEEDEYYEDDDEYMDKVNGKLY